MLCSAASTRWWIVSTGTYVRVPVTFFHSNRSRRLKVSRTCLSYEGHPDRLKASDARLEFETAQYYFNSFVFTLYTSSNVMCKNYGRSNNVNCQRGRRGAEVIMKKLSGHKIFIMKFYIHVIFSNFTKIWSYTVNSAQHYSIIPQTHNVTVKNVPYTKIMIS